MNHIKELERACELERSGNLREGIDVMYVIIFCLLRNGDSKSLDELLRAVVPNECKHVALSLLTLTCRHRDNGVQESRTKLYHAFKAHLEETAEDVAGILYGLHPR